MAVQEKSFIGRNKGLIIWLSILSVSLLCIPINFNLGKYYDDLGQQAGNTKDCLSNYDDHGNIINHDKFNQCMTNAFDYVDTGIFYDYAGIGSIIGSIFIGIVGFVIWRITI